MTEASNVPFLQFTLDIGARDPEPYEEALFDLLSRPSDMEIHRGPVGVHPEPSGPPDPRAVDAAGVLRRGVRDGSLVEEAAAVGDALLRGVSAPVASPYAQRSMSGGSARSRLKKRSKRRCMRTGSIAVMPSA